MAKFFSFGTRGCFLLFSTFSWATTVEGDVKICLQSLRVKAAKKWNSSERSGLAWDPRIALVEENKIGAYTLRDEVTTTNKKAIKVTGPHGTRTFSLLWEGLEPSKTEKTSYLGIARMSHNNVSDLNTNAALLETWLGIQQMFEDGKAAKIRIQVGFNDAFSKATQRSADLDNFHRKLGFVETNTPNLWEITRETIVLIEALYPKAEQDLED